MTKNMRCVMKFVAYLSSQIMLKFVYIVNMRSHQHQQVIKFYLVHITHEFKKINQMFLINQYSYAICQN